MPLPAAARWMLREITLHGSTFRLSHRLDNSLLVGEIGHGMALMHDRWKLHGRPLAHDSGKRRCSTVSPPAARCNRPTESKKPAGRRLFAVADRLPYSDFHHIMKASHRRLKKPPSSTACTATSGASATTLPSSATLTVPICWPAAIG